MGERWGVGTGKVHKVGFDLGTPEAQLRPTHCAPNAHKPIGADTSTIFGSKIGYSNIVKYYYFNIFL